MTIDDVRVVAGALRIHQVHVAAHLGNAQPLRTDHLHGLQLERRIECPAFAFHQILLSGGIIHLSRCPRKLDHYNQQEQPFLVRPFARHVCRFGVANLGGSYPLWISRGLVGTQWTKKSQNP